MQQALTGKLQHPLMSIIPQDYKVTIIVIITDENSTSQGWRFRCVMRGSVETGAFAGF